MKSHTVFLAALFAAAAASAGSPDIVKPQRDLTIIKSFAGDITLLHTLISVNGAHDIELYSFFKRTAAGPAEQIPFARGGSHDAALPVRHGADCALTGVRVLQSGKQLRVVYAARKGDWFDEQPFTYTVYELTSNGGEMPDTPSLYFAEKKKVASKVALCDAGEALDKELLLYR